MGGTQAPAGEEGRLTASERLDLARQHGTKGELLLFCRLCGWQWRAVVRWHEERHRWLLVSRETGICPACCRRYLLLVPGWKLRRLADYDGPLTEAEDRRSTLVLSGRED